MSVRAKFKVQSKTQFEGGVSIDMHPVHGESAENKNFWQYTPSGNLQMHILKGDAAAQFEVGKEYYIDFTLAE